MKRKGLLGTSKDAFSRCKFRNNVANDQIIVNYTYYYNIFLDNDIRVGVNYRKIAEEIKCSYQLYVYSYQRS